MRHYDHAEAIDLSAVAATAAVVPLSTAQVGGLTTTSILGIAIDGAPATEITTSTVTMSAIKTQIDNLAGVVSTIQLGGIVSTSGTSGLSSALEITLKGTAGSATIAQEDFDNDGTATTARLSTAQVSGIATNDLINVYLNGADPVYPVYPMNTTQMGTITSTTLAAALDTIPGIGASSASGAVNITFDAVGPNTLIIPGLQPTVTPGTSANLIPGGSELIAYVNNATTGEVIRVGTTSMSSITSTELAEALDDLDGIGAADDSGDVAVTFDDIGSDNNLRLEGPFPIAVAVTPGTDTSVLGSDLGSDAKTGHAGPFDALYVGVAGDVSVKMRGDNATVLFKALPVGVHDIAINQVNITSTTATTMLGLRAASDRIC